MDIHLKFVHRYLYDKFEISLTTNALGKIQLGELEDVKELYATL